MDKPDLNSTFSTMVRGIHKVSHTSAEEFSKELGIGKTSLLKIERGQCNPTLSTVQTIAENLGCDPRALFGPSIQSDLLAAQYIMMLLEHFEHGDQFSKDGVIKIANLVLQLVQTILEEFAQIERTHMAQAEQSASSSDGEGEL